MTPDTVFVFILRVCRPWLKHFPIIFAHGTRHALRTPACVQDEKADVILKYMADEARNLKQYGELPENIRVNDADVFEEYEGQDDDDIIEFNDVDDI